VAARATQRCQPGRLVHRQDFERLLATRPVQRSAHFALHHVAAVPSRPGAVRSAPAQNQLSTDPANNRAAPVDNSPRGHWLGCLVPKRQARRAVTRSLVKRQMRAVFARHAQALADGLWLLRLKAPLTAPTFVSAASARLTEALRAELEGLLQRASQPSGASPGRDRPMPRPVCP
jgi:ribonuclease P protein component